MACQACYHFDRRKKPVALPTNYLHLNVSQVYTASNDLECPFCTLLVGIFETFMSDVEFKTPSHKQGGLGGPYMRLLSEPGQPLEIMIGEGLGENGESYGHFQCYNSTTYKIPSLPRLPTLTTPSSNFWTDGGLQFFKNRLDYCSKNHGKCPQNDHVELPTRYLDIGTRDGDIIKLCKHSGEKAGRYAALSHRWEGAAEFQTNLKFSTREANHMKEVSWSRLPQKLKDGITLARRLGIRYFWADTLCIIQGDEGKDFTKEAPNMKKYYANAYVTIAAASGSHTPFSMRDENQDYLPVDMEFVDPQDNVGYEVSVRRHFESTEKSPYALGELADRGWILQESALSARILHLAPSELIWECRSEVESECGYEPENIYALGLARKLAETTRQTAHSTWRQMVQSYSNRSLTKHRDALPAISGLAKRIGEIAGLGPYEYLAGLWKGELERDLLWEVIRPWENRPDEGENKPEWPGPWPRLPEDMGKMIRTAPSWSWASIRGAIRTDETLIQGSILPAGNGSMVYDNSPSRINRLFDLLDANCTRKDDYHGQVTDGFIKLRGTMTKVIVECSGDPFEAHSYHLWQPGGRRQSFAPDTILMCIKSPQGGDALTVCRTVPLEGLGGFQSPAFCFFIGYAQMGGGRQYHGLILGHSTRWDKCFERVGYFSSRDPSWFEGGQRSTTVKIV